MPTRLLSSGIGITYLANNMSQAARIRDFVAILENSHLPVTRAQLMDELEI